MENKQLHAATKNQWKSMELEVVKNVPSLSGYYNKLFIDQFEFEQVSKSKYDEMYIKELCLNCGHSFDSNKIKLKLQRKKKHDKNIHRKIGIHCLYCKGTTVKDSQLLKNKINEDVQRKNKDMYKLKATPKLETESSKTVHTPKLNMLQALQCKSSPNTPNSSLTKTPESSLKNSRKKNRGKSFSPLMSIGQKQVKKTPDKPSLLSFLTSL